MSPRRRRVDQELVEQGFFSSADDAMRAIMAGDVSTKDRRISSPGEQVLPGIELHVRGSVPYVSRGGLKLQGGLDHFGLSVEGLDCLDVGCSSGGFTDCLLRRGAASVIAVDVGYAQFDWTLRNDPRVTQLERTNILDVPGIPGIEQVQLAVCDVSFTSVLKILPAVVALLEDEGYFLTLVKPQFEAAREDVGEGGIVQSENVRAAVLARVADGMRAAGFDIIGSCESPIRGHKGNVEFLLLGQLHR